MAERLADAVRFYKLLELLADRVNGPKVLHDCHGRMNSPQRGIYFFYENGEPRAGFRGRTTRGGGKHVHMHRVSC